MVIVLHASVDAHLISAVRTAMDDILEGVNAEGDQTTSKPSSTDKVKNNDINNKQCPFMIYFIPSHTENYFKKTMRS